MRLGVPSLVLFAPLLVACAHVPDLGVRRVDPPLPKLEPGVTRADEVFDTRDHVPLYARSYRAAEGEAAAPRAVIVFVNGLKDHGDHYAAFSQTLAQKGFVAYAFDTRGHGRSAGPRSYVEKFDEYIDDLAAYVEHVRTLEPGKPIFVFGHSMGGAMVTLYAVERHPDVAGIILSAPALEIDAPSIQTSLVRLFDEGAPGAPIFPLPNDNFSRDPGVVAGLATDPLVFDYPATAHLAAEIVGAMHRIWAHPEQLTVPLLALHGTADKITAPSGSRDLVARAGSRDKTLRLYDGFFHDLLHEPDNARVSADITQWLDAHVAQNVEVGTAPLKSDYDPSPDAPALAGDRISASTDVDIDARGEIASLDDVPAAGAAGKKHVYGITGGVRLRQSIGRVGWLGGLDVRAGSESGFFWLADAHPVGFRARIATWQLSLSGGIGARGVDGTIIAHIPSELDVAGSIGPARLLARGGLGWQLNHGGPGSSVLGVADEANALAGIRLGRDIRYWSDVYAGLGPFLAATYARRDGLDFWGLALGLDLWGSN